MLSLDTIGDFTWDFCCYFFIETSEGNLEWSDPDYGGDNSIKRLNCSYKDWVEAKGIPFGRCKGRHTIGGYCGTEVKLP